MSDHKEQLKSMVQDIINDRQDQADATLHSYITAKTAQLAGLAPTPVSTSEIDDEPTE